MDFLDQLEAEAITVLREAACQFRKPALLFSGGKDSTCLIRLARRAFHPARPPFPLLHIDTGHNFEEVLAFRDDLARREGLTLHVRSVEDSIRRGTAAEPDSPGASRNALQSVTLMEAIAELGFDAVIGGARRDEEKARAKERIFSPRNAFGAWDPRDQRPEPWDLLNGRLRAGEHMRIFPLSNWTEMDVWQYIRREGVEVPALYFHHRRRCLRKADGTLLAWADFLRPGDGDELLELDVRCRTVGDVTCTGLVESRASTVDEVIAEVAAARRSERGSRYDDRVSDTAMEDRKRMGYF